jgi:transcriptional regulator with XRE-family HTH domain
MSYILYDMNQLSSPSNLTPKHVRAARALLAWSQQDLAKAAGVATSTVADFERGQRTPVTNNAQAIRAALEGAQIRFLTTGAVIGPTVPAIVPSEKPGAPIRWISAEDLSKWANRTDGAVSLPTLLAHLILATHGTAVQLRFPADEGVRHAGWDGRTSIEKGSVYVPDGDAGWEIGTQRNNIITKATDDYRKRTAEPAPLDPATATYIFITPRHWPKKDEWAKARQDEGVWRNVRVYDANDLVHWIEQTPAVGLWLATRLDKRPPGTRELDEVWQEWSLATKWRLTEDLVLSDRDEDAAAVLRWLRGEPGVLSLQATTTEEVVAFFHATLSELPSEMAAAYRARTLVVTTAAAARTLAQAPAPLILLLTEPDSGLAKSLADRGHYVLQAYDEQLVARGDIRTLARPSREGIASALTASGIAEPRAKALARDSARNLAILRRLIPDAPGRLPKWAQEPPPHALLAALLAGGWDDNSEADQVRLAELADQPYEAVIAALATHVGQFDSPLQKVGSTWRIASPSDAWFLLAQHLTSADITRFEAAAHAILGSADPRFEMDPNERWMAGIHGVRPDYSGVLRHGIGQTLILLALWGDRAHTVLNAGRRADAIVAKLLDNADRQRWWSLSRDFRLLAEASPDAFLGAVEDSLDQNDPAIAALFGHDEDGLFGTEHLSDLMWALEILAWSPDLMPRVTHVLARLDAIDTKPRRYVNGPSKSLREIHLLWIPQTYATLDQRVRALDLIRKWESNAAWKLMLGILPRGHDTSSPSSMPRWRDFTSDKAEAITWPLIGRGAVAISGRLVADVGLCPARWSLLLDRLGDLAPDMEAALAALEAAEPKITDAADRAVLWDKLRSVLHHHRQFPDAEWSLPKAPLDRLQILYDRFAPTDPLERTAWLFHQSVQLPNPSPEGWEGEQREVDTARKEAARSLYLEGGAETVLALARLVDTAGWLGKGLWDSGVLGPDLDAMIEVAVRSEESKERDVAHGLIISAFNELGESWAASLIAQAQDGGWGDVAILTILRALPVTRWTWDQVVRIGGEIEITYWKRLPVFWTSQDSQDIGYAIRKLIEVGRARHALPLTSRVAKVQLPTELLVEVLQDAARQPFEPDGDHNEATMFQHYVTETLGILDERPDVDRNALIALEWNYLSLLEHSRRPAKVLLRALSEHPPLFIQMLSAVFRAKEESGVVDPEPMDPAQARTIATQAYRLLELWDRLPGTREDGTIEGAVLEAWIKEARALAKAAGREDIADSRIGIMLSASPVGADRVWPAEPVREVLDLFRTKPMLEGFRIGKSNRRGVTIRMPRDGGDLERQEAAQFRDWAKAIVFEYPHTAKALDQLADSYEWDAGRQDEDAERLDWEV